MKSLLKRISDSVAASRLYVITVFIAYWISCATGIFMAHSGNSFALSTRDRIVGKALESDKASVNYLNGRKYKAAFLDFAGNLFLGAVPQTALGIGIIVPYFSVAVQGWIGGIVSVDSKHLSRFKDLKSSLYYFLVLLLQFIPYSLTIGAGIKCGVELYKYNLAENSGWSLRRFKFKRSLLSDVAYVYILAIPLFLIASLFEFLSSWNA